MAWMMVLVCLLHRADASLPSVAEVLSRTRWCVGEGDKCPINLPLSFPSCCKPFVCTAIPKTRKPTRFLKFIDYKDYRCLTPETVSLSQNRSVSTVGSKLEETESCTQHNYLVTSSSNVSEYNNSYVQFDDSQAANNGSEQMKSQENNVDDEADYRYSTGNETQLTEYKITSSSEEIPESLNDMGTNHVVKRAIKDNSSHFTKYISSETPTVRLDTINKTLETNSESSEVTMESQESSDVSSASQSNHTAKSQEEAPYTSSSSQYYNEQNKTDNSISTFLSQYSNDLSNTTASEALASANITVDSNALHSSVKNITLNSSTPTATEFSSASIEDYEEDWHSSQMKYDTRPVLHKVVTIPPFHISNLFQSVEVIKLNESVENSLE